MGPIFITLKNGRRFNVAQISDYESAPAAELGGTRLYFVKVGRFDVAESPAEIDALIDAERRRVAVLEALATAEGYLGDLAENGEDCEIRRLGEAMRTDGVWTVGMRHPLYLREELEALADSLVDQHAGHLVGAERLSCSAGASLTRSIPTFRIPGLMSELAERIGPFAEETPDGWKIPVQAKP